MVLRGDLLSCVLMRISEDKLIFGLIRAYFAGVISSEIWASFVSQVFLVSFSLHL
jgi:hypothetical protein